jgi:hypothetical protein
VLSNSEETLAAVMQNFQHWLHMIRDAVVHILKICLCDCSSHRDTKLPWYLLCSYVIVRD